MKQAHAEIVNAGVKMHRLAGVKMHQAATTFRAS